MEMAGTHDLVDLNETEGNIEPRKRRNGIVIGEVRFTPCCSLAQNRELKVLRDDLWTGLLCRGFVSFDAMIR